MSLRDAAQQAIDALELAGMSHDVMLMSDPPQDAWKARSVSWKLAQAMTALRAALAEDGKDWNELEALRESLREHMAEIHRLRLVCRQALAELEKEARSADDWLIMMQSARTALRAALADEQQGTEDGENTMQPTNGVHSRISDCADRGVEAVTDCHEKAADHIPDATKMIKPVAYVTGFSKGYAVVQPVDPCLLMPVGMALYRSPPTSQESRQADPVAWMVYTLDGQSAFVTDNPADFTPEHRALPLYIAPPKRKPLTDEEILECVAEVDEARLAGPITELIRAAERKLGIGGEE